MENIVLTHLTVPEVRQLFRQELASFFASNPQALKKKEDQPDTCDTEQAVKFLNEQGYPISESKLYKLTASRDIPFKNFGRKLIFSRRDLLAWVQGQTTEPNDPATAAALTLARSARRKK